MTLLVFAEFADARHGAIVFDDFTNNGGFRESGETHQIDGGLGVAGAAQDAIGRGAEGKDMAGADEGVGMGGGIGEEAEREGAVGGGNAGGDALGGIDADGEGGFVAF